MSEDPSAPRQRQNLSGRFRAISREEPESLQQFRDLLTTFSRVPESKETSRKTFFEICGISRREVCYSSFLSFYLNPNEEHGFGDLFLRALVQASGQELDTTTFAFIETEVSTGSGRIDLVIQGASFVLGIENKIGAALDNDLKDYFQHLQDLAKQAEPTKTVLALVLSMNDEQECNRFLPVSYRAFIQEVQNQLGHRLPLADHGAITYLSDFINTIHHLEKGIRMDQAQISFFKENEVTTLNLLRKAQALSRLLTEKVKEVSTSIKPPSVCQRPRLYSYSRDGGEDETEFRECVYCDVKVADKVTWSVETGLFLNKGWKLYVFAREDGRAADLDSRLKASGIKFKGKFNGDAWLYAEFPFEESEANVASKYQEFLNEIGSYLNKKKAC